MSLEDNLNAVRQEYLRRMTRGNGHLLHQVETFITSHLGKMLRPRLTLLAADTLGQASTHRTILLATAVEMLHNASLIHDDIIDHDLTRRGQPSVNARWDNSVAVLTGDFLLAQVMRILHEINESDTTQRFYLTVEAMVEAELLQKSEQQSESTYLRIIDGKTASLFATACAIANPLYEDFGFHFGRLFQLRDDLTDGDGTPFTADLIDKEEATLHAIKHTLPIHIN